MTDLDPGEYCRRLEAYLCRKNDGHLIRIVGPAFEQVSGWSQRGIPLRLAMTGIDRYFERYYAKGPRRRPVRIEFCEADVLDVFDEWRRSVGVTAAAAEADPSSQETTTGRSGMGSLPAHLDRVIARLTTMRGGGDRGLDTALESAVRELDAMRGAARGARGDARDDLLSRLRSLDAALVSAVRMQSTPETLQRASEDADEELRSFRGRLTPEAYEHARQACIDRSLRERARLPALIYE